MTKGDKSSLLRKIPSVSCLLPDVKLSVKGISQRRLLQEIRNYLQNLRERICQNKKTPELVDGDISYPILLQCVQKRIRQLLKPKLCRAINATGVILHTGLGRAILPPSSIVNICEHLKGFTVLEIDCETGERTKRDIALQNLLCTLTGAEDATIVNNNAAAVLLVLTALAFEKEVIVSRGQLVEIGGGFRIPEVMKQSNARLVEVGCTNKVYISDYRNAITNQTVAILSVHTSNFKILGFTHEVPIEQLARLAKEKGLYVIQDAGSGAMVDIFPWGLGDEPLISDSIHKGIDLVCFSGDKLLGACQAGIIVGKKILIEKIRRHPLARALRVDKVTLSVLESTLQHYLDPETLTDHIPTLQMLTERIENIKKLADDIAQRLQSILPYCQVKVIPTASRVGSGAFPVQDIPGYAVCIKSKLLKTEELARQLRISSPPIFVRIHDDSLILEVRTLIPGDDIEIVSILSKVYADCIEKGEQHTQEL